MKNFKLFIRGALEAASVLFIILGSIAAVFATAAVHSMLFKHVDSGWNVLAIILCEAFAIAALVGGVERVKKGR